MPLMDEIREMEPATGRVQEVYEYTLPPELIAHEPPADRTSSRLLVVDRREGTVTERVFHQVVDFFRPGDLLVRNDTRVFKARLEGQRAGTGAKIELLCYERVEAGVWRALAKPAKRVREGESILIGDMAVAVVGRGESGERTIQLPSGMTEWEFFDRAGQVPLPPYVAGRVGIERYQTTYATRPGAVAAPTAGFHFTPELFAELGRRGVDVTDVTLHVGPGTFLPVREDDFRRHEMHREWYEVGEEAAAKIARAKAEGRRVIPIGSTSMRVLETIAQEGALGRPATGWTRLFMVPGSRFQICDAMVTNFHLPRTTLILLVMAFGGVELIGRAYETAIREKFRFYSFGDAMLIL
jgi:S-adenosylmethionine:tRNA ribosyltransferase-isomerase